MALGLDGIFLPLSASGSSPAVAEGDEVINGTASTGIRAWCAH